MFTEPSLGWEKSGVGILGSSLTQTGPLQVPQLPTALSPVGAMSGVLRIPLFSHFLGICVTLMRLRAHLWGSSAPLTPKDPWRLEMQECGARM